jgi:hypothetical protein
VVAQVVEVGAQHDSGPFGVRQGADDVDELGLAVVAPVGGVGDVVRPIQLAALDRPPAQAPLSGQGGALEALLFGQRGGDGGERLGVDGPERVVGDPG